MVAVRCEVDVFAAATAVIVPSFEPEVGLIVSQLADDVADQEVLLSMLTVLLSDAAS